MYLSCPWGTQAMAENILDSIKGFKYQPYTADGALIDPAAELGDGVSINGIYSGIYTQNADFGSAFTASISAPTEEEIDHEYPYVPKQERKVSRSLRQLTAELKVQAGLISAEVSERVSDVDELKSSIEMQSGKLSAYVRKSGGDASSFGWELTDSSWAIKAGGSEILKATKSGLEIKGLITATGGKIGGFDIQSDYLSYNGQTWDGTNTTGAYLGTSGLQLGKNFKVDMQGNLTATNGTFSGYVKAGKIQYGDEDGTISGKAISLGSITGGVNGALASGTISTLNFASGISTSLGYADFANSVLTGKQEAENLKISPNGSLNVPGTFKFRESYIKKSRISVKDKDGKTVEISYLEW